MGWAVTRGTCVQSAASGAMCLFLPALCAAIGVSSGSGRAPHPTVRVRGVPAPRLCKHRDWAKATTELCLHPPSLTAEAHRRDVAFPSPNRKTASAQGCPKGAPTPWQGRRRRRCPRCRQHPASDRRGGLVAPGPHAGPGAATLLSGPRAGPTTGHAPRHVPAASADTSGLPGPGR